jgi:outer membrane protein assembly factor BamB
LTVIDSSFETFPVEDLKLLVEQGTGLLKVDRRRTRALLKDQFPEYQLQIHVLSTALDTDVPSALLSAAERRALPVEAGRLTQMLISRYGLQEYVARWAVAAWGFAVGIWPSKAVSDSLIVGGPAHWAVSADSPGPAPTAGDWAPSAAVTVGQEDLPEGGTGGSPYPPSHLQTDPATAADVPANGGGQPRNDPAAGHHVDAPVPIPVVDSQVRDQHVEKSPKAETGSTSRRNLVWVLPVGLLALAVAAVGAVFALSSGSGGVHPIWTASVGTPNSAPVFADGSAILGTGTSIKAFRPSDGHVVWTTTDSDGKPPYLGTDGTDLFIANGLNLYSINGNDGSANWRAKLQTDGLRSLTPAPPVVGGGLVFASANNHTRLYGVSATDGTYENYIYSPKGKSTYFQPAFSNGIVFIPEHYAGGIYVSAWKADTPSRFHTVGKDIWFVKTGVDKPFVEPSISAGPGGVYLMNNGTHEVYSLRSDNGHTLWHTKIGSSPAAPGALYGSTIFVPSGNTLYARRTGDGSSQWTFTAGGGISSTPAISHGVVYFGAGDNLVYAVSASSGKKLWTYKTGGPVRVSPAISGGRLLVASNDGKLYAFKATGS